LYEALAVVARPQATTRGRSLTLAIGGAVDACVPQTAYITRLKTRGCQTRIVTTWAIQIFFTTILLFLQEAEGQGSVADGAGTWPNRTEDLSAFFVAGTTTGLDDVIEKNVEGDVVQRSI